MCKVGVESTLLSAYKILDPDVDPEMDLSTSYIDSGPDPLKL